MTAPLRVRLTGAQAAALECRPRGPEAVEPDDALIERALVAGGGRALAFDATEREALFDALNDASNAEADHADLLRRDDPAAARLTRGAAVALGNLAGRVLRAGDGRSEPDHVQRVSMRRPA